MNSGGTWSDVAGATSPTLMFTATAGDNGFEYEAVFTNVVGSATTSAATLLAINAATTSDNWSGYDVTAAAGAFTAVAGTWNVIT